MFIGEVRDEIQDSDGNTVGFVVRQGLDGLNAKELRYWRQLYLRRVEEQRKDTPG